MVLISWILPDDPGGITCMYVTSVKNKNKYFIYATSFAMATPTRTIDRVHSALFGLFLTISEHIFLFLSASPHHEQNDT